MKKSKSSISKDVMSQIKHGKVRMKPKLYHVLLGITTIGSVIATGFTIAYLSSIMFFWVRVQTAGTMAWGARANLEESIASFPWWALLLAVILLVVAIYLVRDQGRLYKHKAGTIAVVIVTSSIILGLIFSMFDIGKNHVPNTRPNFDPPGQGWQRQIR